MGRYPPRPGPLPHSDHLRARPQASFGVAGSGGTQTARPRWAPRQPPGAASSLCWSPPAPRCPAAHPAQRSTCFPGPSCEGCRGEGAGRTALEDGGWGAGAGKPRDLCPAVSSGPGSETTGEEVPGTWVTRVPAAVLPTPASVAPGGPVGPATAPPPGGTIGQPEPAWYGPGSGAQLRPDRPPSSPVTSP